MFAGLAKSLAKTDEKLESGVNKASELSEVRVELLVEPPA
jgi:hypothetical protein